MSGFSSLHDTLPHDRWHTLATEASSGDVLRVLRQGRCNQIDDFARLLSPSAAPYLEQQAALAQRITQRHFGKIIRLFAPIYLSNECVNICKYCGFSRNNPIPRITLPVNQVVEETRQLASQGFRSLLIVAGEHPKYVSNGYVEDVIRRCLEHMPSLSIELGPMETQDYFPLVRAGCEGLVVYQETYHEPTYRDLHTAGPKKHYHWRMDTAERAYHAGFRRLGIGALYGLYDWRYEALSVAAHAQYLLKHCWKAQLSISLPRMRPAAGGFQPDSRFYMSDRELVQLIAAFRLLLPTVGITLSTREPSALRDGLITLGVTQMSAGSCTEPGGYSDFDPEQWQSRREQPGEQFHIADERSPAAIAAVIRSRGYEPVWKDFDTSLVAPAL
jgi:2-iminoacetate synthase